MFKRKHFVEIIFLKKLDHAKKFNYFYQKFICFAKLQDYLNDRDQKGPVLFFKVLRNYVLVV